MSVTDENSAQRLQLVVTLKDRRTTFLLPLLGFVVVGRSSDADVQIDDPFAATRHARLHVSGRAIQIEDLGSMAGTFANGRRLTAGECIPLDLDTPVVIGRTVLSAQPVPEQ
jgi:pSer/pThr/pTyr-binding forkhead associated (FHA) protein